MCLPNVLFPKLINTITVLRVRLFMRKMLIWLTYITSRWIHAPVVIVNASKLHCRKKRASTIEVRGRLVVWQWTDRIHQQVSFIKPKHYQAYISNSVHLFFMTI